MSVTIINGGTQGLGEALAGRELVVGAAPDLRPSLAIARPDVEWILIEPMERRIAWLTEQKDALGLENVEVLRARAEDWRRGPVLDAVTARAVSAMRTLVPLTAPLVRDGGELILMKGAHPPAGYRYLGSSLQILARVGIVTVDVYVKQ